MRQATEPEDCLQAALRLLKYRPRSRKELESRLLQKSFLLATVQVTLTKLEELGQVDDEAFARFWKESRESFNPRSRWLLQQELKQKGVAQEVAISLTQDMDETEAAYRAGEKRARTLPGLDYTTFRKKLSSFLRRRGFPWELTRLTISRLWREKEL